MVRRQGYGKAGMMDVIGISKSATSYQNHLSSIKVTRCSTKMSPHLNCDTSGRQCILPPSNAGAAHALHLLSLIVIYCPYALRLRATVGATCWHNVVIRGATVSTTLHLAFRAVFAKHGIARCLSESAPAIATRSRRRKSPTRAHSLDLENMSEKGK